MTAAALRRCDRDRPSPRRAPTSTRAPRVEDRGELAQHAVLLHLRHPGANRRFVDAEAFGEDRERTGVEREVPLDRVEELAVEVVEHLVLCHFVCHRMAPHIDRRPMLVRTARRLRFRPRGHRRPGGRLTGRPEEAGPGLSPAGPELDPHLHHVVPAADADGNRVTRLEALDERGDVADRLDRVSVDRLEEVVHAHSASAAGAWVFMLAIIGP